jgi:hypothetical protein
MTHCGVHSRRNFLLCGLLVSATSPAYASSSFDFHANDPGFNGGVALDDRFATGPDTPHYAEKIVALPNGEVVVAGLVPTASQTGNIVGGNIGLVHYAQDGARIGWANPGAGYASYFNIYITYPNSALSTYSHIADMKVVGDYIYVLADYASGSSDKDVHVIVFGTDGHFIGAYAAFTTGLYEFGAGLVPYHYTLIIGGVPKTFTKLIAVATYNSGNVVEPNNTQVPHWVVTMKRFSIGDGGTLSVDNTFGHIGNGAIDQPLPVDFCNSDTTNRCSGSAAYVSGARTDTGTPTLYVLGNLAIANNKTDVFVMAVDGSSGDLLPAFGTGGIYYQAVQYGSSYFGFVNYAGPAKGIRVGAGADPGGDLLYVATADNAYVSCSDNGAAIYKLRANAGPPFNSTLPDFSWAVGGKATVAAPPQCDPAANSAASLRAAGIADDGSRIAVVGVNGGGDAVLSLVRLADGKTTEFSVHPWLRSDGSRWAGNNVANGLDSGFNDVVSAGNNRWTATGTMCDSTAAVACALFGTTRLYSDEIFGDGFN